jgi:hypothetical protein
MIFSQQHFDNTFVLGRTIAMGFAQVRNSEGLELKWMGLPNFKVPKKQIESVRLGFGGRSVQVTTEILKIKFEFGHFKIHYIYHFYEGNIKLCTEGLEAAGSCYIEEEVGNVRVYSDILQENGCAFHLLFNSYFFSFFKGLMGKKAKIWITHISKSCGCNWMMVPSASETGRVCQF